MDKEKIIKAGKIASECKKFARSLIKKDVPLLEIAEKIENKIVELGGQPAFPVNLSIHEIAAHYTPTHDDVSTAHGLLKIDLGVHIDGWIADTAFSLDLENNEENKKLIEAAEAALENATQLIKSKIPGAMVDGKTAEQGLNTDEIGETIQNTIEEKGFSPIINLSGHQIDQYDLHAGLNIPNVKDGKNIKLKKGLYAVEPFATSGNGKVYDGKPSGIYSLIDSKNIRSPIAREVLKLIKEDYQKLPFCSRWIVKKLGAKALFGLRQLEENGNLHNFPQLIESGKGKVAQAENTFLIEENEVIVTTKED